MKRLAASAVLMATTLAMAGLQDDLDAPATNEDTLSTIHVLMRDVPGVRIHRAPDGRIDRIFGKILTTGGSAMGTAERFIDQYSTIWNVDAQNLKPGGVIPSGVVEQPLMYDRERGTFRFTGVYFNQRIDDVPVFGGRLCVLTRNSSDHGAVMAAADLRDLGNFEVSSVSPSLTSDARMTQMAQALLADDRAVIESSPRTVVFAGYDMDAHSPVMALEFVAVAGDRTDPDTYQKRRFVVEAETGTVLHDENMILSCQPTQTRLGSLVVAAMGEVTGTVRGNTTSTTRADACDPEFLTPLPYAAVTANGQTVYADANGSYSHPHSGGNTSFGGALGGQWFIVNNEAGSTTTASNTGSNGDVVNISYNTSPSELVTAQTNAYREANRIRDLVLASNPAYPTIGTQTFWPINCNIGSSCNAFYDYSSINFYQNGGGCNNTAFSVVVHHEYGHHLVAEAGSGQGEYGEGFGDVMGVILTGDSQLARGFYASDCNSGIRNADNSCQYSASSCSSCGSAIHSCGQLISGCVWDTWGSLEISHPLTATQVIRDLAINSMPLHSGTSINDSIAIDFVTLDDDDGNIDNGSPHYADIAFGFGSHGLNVPELALLSITAPEGLPEYVSPNGTSAVRVSVSNLSGQFEAGSGRMFVGQGGSYDQIPLTPDGNALSATFPATPCGDVLEYFFAASTTSGQTVYWPGDAPSSVHVVTAANGPPIVIADEDFATDAGYQPSGTAADGAWTHGTPVNCDRGDPDTDYDGNNACWLTDNSAANGCNSDVDDGTVTLTSPAMDASEPGLQLCYARWFSNDSGAAPYTDSLVVQISINNGASWLNLETVGPDGPEVSGGWFDVCHTLSAVSGFEPTTQLRLRVSTSDGSTNGSVVEAALDAVSLSKADCDDAPCPGDLDGDGEINVNDVLACIAAFGSGADGDVDGDGDTDVNDLLALVGGWGPCV